MDDLIGQLSHLTHLHRLVEAIKRPAYSPDLAPGDYNLGGQRIQKVKEIQRSIRWFRSQDSEFYHRLSVNLCLGGANASMLIVLEKEEMQIPIYCCKIFSFGLGFVRIAQSPKIHAKSWKRRRTKGERNADGGIDSMRGDDRWAVSSPKSFTPICSSGSFSSSNLYYFNLSLPTENCRRPYGCHFIPAVKLKKFTDIWSSNSPSSGDGNIQPTKADTHLGECISIPL